MRGPTLEEIIARQDAEWGGVKRDMEVIRAVLAHIEGRTDLEPKLAEVAGLDPLIVQAHVWMLQSEGFLNTTQNSHPAAATVPRIFVRDLSWSGHDLAGVLNETSWDRIKKRLNPMEIAALTLKELLAVGAALTKAEVMARMGHPPG